MRAYNEPARNRRTGGNPRRTVRSAEPPIRTDLRGQSPAALLALQRAIGNAAVTRLLVGQRDREPPGGDQPRLVQRLKVHGGAPVTLADQTDSFLLGLVRTIDADSGARTYTSGGVTYDIGSKDLETAKQLLTKRQKKLTKTYKDYDDYAEKQKGWREKREKKPVATLATGTYLYHGTSKEVALIVKDSGLSPAQPGFRKGKWDASRDGFLSMTKDRKTVTVKADSIVLRMEVRAGDLDTWQWKDVGGDNEVVSTREVPEDRLEWWSADKKTWQPMSALS